MARCSSRCPSPPTSCRGERRGVAPPSSLWLIVLVYRRENRRSTGQSAKRAGPSLGSGAGIKRPIRTEGKRGGVIPHHCALDTLCRLQRSFGLLGSPSDRVTFVWECPHSFEHCRPDVWSMHRFGRSPPSTENRGPAGRTTPGGGGAAPGLRPTHSSALRGLPSADWRSPAQDRAKWRQISAGLAARQMVTFRGRVHCPRMRRKRSNPDATLERIWRTPAKVGPDATNFGCDFDRSRGMLRNLERLRGSQHASQSLGRHPGRSLFRNAC